jgi:hypothetical protein
MQSNSLEALTAQFDALLAQCDRDVLLAWLQAATERTNLLTIGGEKPKEASNVVGYIYCGNCNSATIGYLSDTCLACNTKYFKEQ